MSAPLNTRRLEFRSAIDYVLGVLEAAGATNRLKCRDRLAEGEFLALVPDDASTAQVLRFGAGGLLQGEGGVNCAVVREVPNTIPTLASLVATCAQALRDPVLWFHEPLLGEDEIAARWLRPKRVDKALFLVAEGDSARQPGRVAESLDYSMLSWHLLAFVTDGVHRADAVASLLERSDMVVVGAYDGESVLLWRRTSVQAGGM